MAYILNIADIESAKNKTTVIDENSTDQQYPSAKAVYDKVGNIDVSTKQDKFGEVVNKEGYTIITTNGESIAIAPVIDNDAEFAFADKPHISIDENSVSLIGENIYIGESVFDRFSLANIVPMIIENNKFVADENNGTMHLPIGEGYDSFVIGGGKKGELVSEENAYMSLSQDMSVIMSNGLVILSPQGEAIPLIGVATPDGTELKQAANVEYVNKLNNYIGKDVIESCTGTFTESDGSTMKNVDGVWVVSQSVWIADDQYYIDLTNDKGTSTNAYFSSSRTLEENDKVIISTKDGVSTVEFYRDNLSELEQTINTNLTGKMDKFGDVTLDDTNNTYSLSTIRLNYNGLKIDAYTDEASSFTSPSPLKINTPKIQLTGFSNDTTQISGVATPIDDSDAANKSYVDNTFLGNTVVVSGNQTIVPIEDGADDDLRSVKFECNTSGNYLMLSNGGSTRFYSKGLIYIDQDTTGYSSNTVDIATIALRLQPYSWSVNDQKYSLEGTPIVGVKTYTELPEDSMVNINGALNKFDLQTQAASKGYVDDRIAELVERIAALEG